MVQFLPKKIKMRTNLTYCIPVFGMLACVFFTSCSKTTPAVATVLSVDSSKTVTAYDSTVSFSNYKTVSLPDSVAVINGSTVTYELTSADSAYFVSFRSSLTARGFSVVSKTAHPDIVLNITRIASTVDGMVDSTSYWSNYASFYNPSADGESGLPYVVNFNTSAIVGDGLLSFEMLDLKNAAANNHIAIIWDGIVSGYALLSDLNSASVETGIMFGKSLYLKTN